MPIIIVNTSIRLTPEQKDGIKSGLGRAIELIPGKTEPFLMVDISDGRTIYWAGEQRERMAHVDVRIMGTCEFSIKAEFTREVYRYLNEVTGLESEEVMLFFYEMDTWGAVGELRTIREE
jgi:phenylpyruvate tautomerase PptA (4-oxalocrotonate tautomerase family)